MTKLDFKYGLMVINPETKEVVHFVGYWNQPTEDDIESLRSELAKDEEFGLTEIVHKLNILPAPEHFVKQVISDLSENLEDENEI